MHLSITLFITAHFFDILNSIHQLLRIGFLILHCWKTHQSLFYLLESASSIILLQFQFLLTKILFVGTWLFSIQIWWDSDYLTKSCNWQKPIKQHLFDSTMRDVDSTNVVLKYLPSKAIGKRLDEEQALFDYFDGS